MHETNKSTCVICGLSFQARHSYGLCSRCFSRDVAREFDRVESTVKKARRDGIFPISLCLPEWLSVLSDYAGCCAFCQQYTANVIEMFNPSEGYTYANVVPACKACSTLRRQTVAHAEARIATYLASSRPIKLFRDMGQDYEYEKYRGDA
jgi:hypothetical protein